MRPSAAVVGLLLAVGPRVRFVFAGFTALALVYAPDVRAAPPPPLSPALVLELVDAEPIGVRVEVPSPSGCAWPVATVFDGVVAKGKPVTIASAASRLCVRQTSAPFTKVGHGPPLLLHPLPGAAPIWLRLRSRPESGSVAIGPTSPLVLAVDGEQPIGVRVSAGTTTPCDSSSNASLFAGVLRPGQPLAIPTEAVCVCYEQTSAPFVTTGWSPATVRCRPTSCAGTTIAKKPCVVDMQAPFTFWLPSKLP